MSEYWITLRPSVGALFSALPSYENGSILFVFCFATSTEVKLGHFEAAYVCNYEVYRRTGFLGFLRLHFIISRLHAIQTGKKTEVGC